MEEEGGEEEQGGDVPPNEGDDPNIEDPNGDELVNMALNGIPLNGERVDRTDVHPEVHPVPIGPTGPENEDNMSDHDMGPESAEDRRRRYLSSSQDEVSDPDEWATLNHGHLDSDAHDRMRANSQANRIRLRRAAETLCRRHDEAATVGNWEVAGEMLRALHEVESLMDIF